jgi:hypothetical protein
MHRREKQSKRKNDSKRNHNKLIYIRKREGRQTGLVGARRK